MNLILDMNGCGALAEKDISWFSSGETGRGEERLVLSNPLTPEQEEFLKQYDNVRISKSGASYKYAPERKYDVIYVADVDEGEGIGSGVAEEAFEDEIPEELEEFSDEDNSEEIMAQLDADIASDYTQDVSRFSMISQATDMVNQQILLYKQMAERWPDDKEILEGMIDTLVDHTGKLQALKSKDPDVALNFERGLVEGDGSLLAKAHEYDEEHEGEEDL